MNLRFAALALLAGATVPAYAGTAVYTQCGPHDGYILMYKSTEKFEELAKLRCGERVQLVDRTADYLEVVTGDGRTGWVVPSDVSDDAPASSNDLVAAEPSHAAANASYPALPMTNQAVLDMHRAHASNEAILSKIRLSQCSFSTSEYSLHELKAAGVSDKVILAMLSTPKPSTAADDPDERKIVVPAGTPVEVALSQEVSGDLVEQGTVVKMTVVNDVTVNGVVVIAKGAFARARVMGVKKPGSFERTGEVAWFMQDASTVSGDAVPVGFAAKQPNLIPTGKFEGYSFLLSQYRKGAPALVPQDRTFIAVVSTDTVMRVPQAAVAAPASPSLASTGKNRAFSMLGRQ
jgi:hypothetical protein